MKPEIKRVGTNFEFYWKEVQIQATVQNIHQHRDGRITAEVLFKSLAEIHPHILQTQINLLSERSKSAIAKRLNETYPLNEWDSIIEQLCVLTLEGYRKGEPLQFISTEEEAKPPEYLIKPLIPLNLPTTIFGLPGTMKSYIALLCATLSTLPWDDNPLGFTTPKESTPALYLDYESSRDLMSWRLKRLQKGFDLPSLFSPYRRCSMPFADDLQEISKIVLETGAKLIIIDSLGGACGGDIYAPEPALRFFSALRTLNCTSLILAHTSKEASKGKSIIGTVYFTAYSRQIWFSKVSQETGENEVSVALFHQKSNEDKLSPPIGLHFVFSEDEVAVKRQDVQGIAAFLEQLSLSQKILEILKESPMTLSEMADTLEASRNVMGVTLARLKSKGQVVKLSEKKWALKAQEEFI